MREISNKLSLGYFLNKNDNCSNAHSGIEDIIKISKHKIMNRCAHAIMVDSTFHFYHTFSSSLFSDQWFLFKD